MVDDTSQTAGSIPAGAGPDPMVLLTELQRTVASQKALQAQLDRTSLEFGSSPTSSRMT